MGPVEHAIRSACHDGQRLLTPTGRGEFTIEAIDDDGVVLLLGAQETRTPLGWSCLEGAATFLAGRDWVQIGGRYDTSADADTFDGYLKGCIKRATAGWVAALVEQAGLVEIDRARPSRLRFRPDRPVEALDLGA